jgi:hypothetical protein
MHSSTRFFFLLVPLTIFLLAACAEKTPQPLESFATNQVIPTRVYVWPATYTPIPSATHVPLTATPVPSPTLTPEPTLEATPITPLVTGASVGPYAWSPNSRWLPFVDFTAQTLHFYDAAKATTCDFPFPIKNPDPNHFIAWLPDGRVIVQTAEKVMTGLPCGKFDPAVARETLVLDHQAPSYSPDGRYQAVSLPYKGTSQDVNTVIDLQDVATGKNLVEATFFGLPRSSSGIPGYWLDKTHFLIPTTADQGPLLLIPGKPVVKIAADIFQQPLKPGKGTYDFWMARSAVTENPPRFHLLLIGTAASQAVTNPLQIYHSETGQVELLPYTAVQAAFTNDGHWLLVGKGTGQTLNQALIRPLDPQGAPFTMFTDQSSMYYTWSPDGSKALGMSKLADQQSVIALFSSPQRTFLTAWRASDYQLSPYWSPDGKYLAVSARSYKNNNQQAIYVIRIAGN